MIDYKTSQHLGSGLEEFLDREVERYHGQLQRYARLAQRLGPEPVRLGLYFPLMRAWREWEHPPPIDKRAYWIYNSTNEKDIRANQLPAVGVILNHVRGYHMREWVRPKKGGQS